MATNRQRNAYTAPAEGASMLDWSPLMPIAELDSSIEPTAMLSALTATDMPKFVDLLVFDALRYVISPRWSRRPGEWTRPQE